MSPDSNDKASPGPFRAFANLFRRGPSTPQPSDPLPVEGHHPTSIGKYAITREIGRGGMGIVYAARDQSLDRLVAIKVISAGAGQAAASPPPDDESRKRLLRGGARAAGVNHPNTAQIYEIGEHRGEPFLAMELLEGESLSDRLADGPL